MWSLNWRGVLIVHGILRPDLATPKELMAVVRRYVKSMRDRAA
jgi:hypothetical protein